MSKSEDELRLLRELGRRALTNKVDAAIMGSEEEEVCMDGGRVVDNRTGEKLYTVVAIDERGYVLDVGEIYSVADWPYVAAWRDGDRAGIALSTVPTFDPMYTKDFLAAPSVMFHVMVNNMARVMGQRDALAELVAAIRDGNPGVEEMPLWADALSSGALEGWV